MKEHKDWIVRYFSEHEDDEEDGIILNELIRCRDCKFYPTCIISKTMFIMGGDGYCANAVRDETES